MSRIQGYDVWKVDELPGFNEEEKPFSMAVPSFCGISAWQFFCNFFPQGEVEDWAWEACQKGPFTMYFSKLVYFLNYCIALAQCKKNLDMVAAKRSRWAASQTYLDACEEVERTWSEEFSSYILTARQWPDLSIHIYQTIMDEY